MTLKNILAQLFCRKGHSLYHNSFWLSKAEDKDKNVKIKVLRHMVYEMVKRVGQGFIFHVVTPAHYTFNSIN